VFARHSAGLTDTTEDWACHVTHDSLRYINILTYLLTYLISTVQVPSIIPTTSFTCNITDVTIIVATHCTAF